MIARINKAASFSKCIGYVLSDKRSLTDEQKKELSIRDGVRHINRAEVLLYNYCFGNKKELIRQFKDVRNLNARVEKPGFHIWLRPSPADRVSNKQWISIINDVLKEYGFEKNQFIAVMHHDAKQKHVHLVINRVAYDGRVINDILSYYRMTKLCRELEIKYQLEKIQNPRLYQSPEERKAPRINQQRQHLKKQIELALKNATTYPQFEQAITARGYKPKISHGITFYDENGVWQRGCDVGHSLPEIESRLAQNLALEQTQKQELENSKQQSHSRRMRLHL